MKNKLKKIPSFKSEAQERAFWETHATEDYFDFDQEIEFDLSDLRPSTKPVTIRLPVSLIDDLKRLAHKHDVPYQSMMKLMLAREVKRGFKQM